MFLANPTTIIATPAPLHYSPYQKPMQHPVAGAADERPIALRAVFTRTRAGIYYCPLFQGVACAVWAGAP
jgi:hypothetical protein